MLFNSLEFLVFFPTVTLLYFLLPHPCRWMLLLAASCLFYMAFIPVYILILLTTIVIDYAAAIYIEKSQGRRKKVYLVVSILSTCAVLFVFKYFNFFNASFSGAARFLGLNYPGRILDIILPIGLSFHTFQSLSYVIEVYRGNQKAEKHFGIYSLYVMFYPQLVAGPIERPQNLLHQFYEKHHFEYQRVTDGLKLMMWGLFKKVVIADRLAIYVQAVYSNPDQHNGVTMAVATVFFAFQIYCDFSGYSDIAVGSARVMGFHLMQNFNKPYFSKSIAEFWKRWHISLSTWFKDYVYIPMGGNRVAVPRFYFNLLVTFLLSGLWHGSNWTYIFWGALNGFYLIGSHLTSPARHRFASFTGLARWPQFLNALRILVTFTLVCLAWVFFRAERLSDAFLIIRRIFTVPGPLFSAGFRDLSYGMAGIAILLVADYWSRGQSFDAKLSAQKTVVRWSVYCFMAIGMLMAGVFSSAQFIYFQF